jgi:plastocyanin
VLLRLPIAVTLLAVAAALLIPGAAVSRSTQSNQLEASVGPGFSISLKQSDGSVVVHLDPGTYTIHVTDRSEEHNFHLMGPGVDQATDVETTGETTWTVTFTDGTYRYQCDAHPTQMKGKFTAGTVTTPPPPPAKPKPKKLVGSVGPGHTISMKTAAGTRVKAVKAGSYRVTVRDATSSDNFHLLGPGLSKRTGVEYKGTTNWTVKLRKGKTYRYRSDPHPSRMKGSFRAT